MQVQQLQLQSHPRSLLRVADEFLTEREPCGRRAVHRGGTPATEACFPFGKVKRPGQPQRQARGRFQGILAEKFVLHREK